MQPARIAHHIPSVVVHDHLDQDVAGEELALYHVLLAVLDLRHHLRRHLDVADQILQTAVIHHGLKVRRYLVLIAGISVYDVPERLVGLFFHFGVPPFKKSSCADDQAQNAAKGGVQQDHHDGSDRHADEHDARCWI